MAKSSYKFGHKLKKIYTYGQIDGMDKITGAQIDLVIDQRDQVINICEMKFSVIL